MLQLGSGAGRAGRERSSEKSTPAGGGGGGGGGVPASVPASGAPASGAPASGVPASGGPASGVPASAPASGVPASVPASGVPASMPASGVPASGTPPSEPPPPPLEPSAVSVKSSPQFPETRLVIPAKPGAVIAAELPSVTVSFVAPLTTPVSVTGAVPESVKLNEAQLPKSEMPLATSPRIVALPLRQIGRASCRERVRTTA